MVSESDESDDELLLLSLSGPETRQRLPGDLEREPRPRPP